MPWPTDSGSSPGGLLAARLPASRTIWDLAIVVLGLNIWVSFLLLPVLHLDQPGIGPFEALLLVAGPISLGLGAWWRHPLLLLAVYPALLLSPVLAAPQLVGANVYTPWTFVLVAVSLLAYMLATPLLLALIQAPGAQHKSRDLDVFPYTPKWRRRTRVYRGLAILAALFPVVLVCTLFLHPGVRADLERHYPGRLSESWALFGLLLLLLWLGLFHTYFLRPLKSHVRGDPQTRYEVQRLRRDLFSRRVRPAFYLYVALALVLMAVLVLFTWR